MRVTLRGRRSIWCSWRVTVVAPRIVSDASYVKRINHESFFRGRRSILFSWRMIPVAPRIVNDVSCETRINHEIHFAWQAQYLVKLDCVSCCSASCK